MLATGGARVRTRAGTAVVLGALAAVLVVHTAAHGTGVGDAAYLIGNTGAAALGWWALGTVDRARRGAWRLIVVGVTANALAEWAWQVHTWTAGEPPTVSTADVFWIVSYLALFAGLLQLLHGGSSERRDIDGLIDMAVMGIVAVLLVWPYAIETVFADDTVSRGVQAVWVSYPILDSILFGLVLRALASRRARTETSALLGLGAIAWLGADFAYMFVASAPSYSVWLDNGWIVGAVLIGASVWQRADRQPLDERAPERVGVGRIALGFLPLLVPAGLETWYFTHGDEINPWPLLVATAALLALGFARSLRLARAHDRARAELELRERYYETLSRHASDAVLVLDGRGHIRHVSPSPTAVFGDSTQASGFVHPDDLELALQTFAQAIEHPGLVFECEVRARPNGDGVSWYAARIISLLHDPNVEGVVVNLHDVTERKVLSAELEHRAFHDALTGLANRALLRDRVEHAAERAERTGGGLALVYLDLDRFKLVNDTLGHDAGDEVLREIARRLRRVVRRSDTVARLGGDEFAILVEDSRHARREAEHMAERIVEILRTPVRVIGRDVTMSASIGIASDLESPAASLLRHADVAMYRAKDAGDGVPVLYDPSMRGGVAERFELETDIFGVVERNELRLVYQPVVALETGALVGFEALVRWDHPGRGTIGPDTFIPIAEANGSIVPIGQWVLREACRTASHWQRAYPEARGMAITVNVSARQLAHPDFVDDVERTLAETGLAAGSLVLEMTETVLVRDAVTTAQRLRVLHDLGVGLAIDDFGTGYSSLSYLRQFPVDILKIDRSFVSGITGAEFPAILRGLLDLGRTLQLETIAEGVETEQERDRLRAEGCGFAQGFLFATPLDAAEAELLLVELEPGVLPWRRARESRPA
ncbi:MAG TPA: EAL domain-containing protein [Acidimicrobiia bacterium]|nr:EAL domain-containing protein [Acidimicrobiia bacterium]